jgi:hypothetical protein
MNQYFTTTIILMSAFVMIALGGLSVIYAQPTAIATGCPQGQIQVVDEKGSPMFYPGTDRPLCKPVDAVGSIFGR